MPFGCRRATNRAANSRTTLGSAKNQTRSLRRGVSSSGDRAVTTSHIFHITERRAFSAALEAGAYEADSLASEGFIHCSTREQILRTASRFYAGRSGLVLLCINADQLGAALRFEAADGEEFPHCYGKVPIEAIPAVIDFPCRPDGSFTLPDELALFAD